ncbi:MAG: MFS transporter [Chloroflexi bacterium]|nr:MFS transporter [Chloroflexota bacterium]MBM4454685.1 MFS transporter [Chloroflexota bacterium]
MRNSFTLVTLYIVAFVGFTGFSFMFPVIPLYAAELGANVAEVGLIAAMNSYVAAILLIPFGLLSDRLGRHRLLGGGLTLFTVAPLLYPLASNPMQLVLVRILHGAAAAAFLPAAIALVIDLTSSEKRGTAIGWYTASLQLGLMAGPITGGFLLKLFGFDPVFYTCAAVSAVALILISVRVRAFVYEPAHQATEGSSWDWVKQPLVFAGLMTPMFIAIGSGTIGTYIPFYGNFLGINEASAGTIITAMYASSALLRIPAGRLADRADRRLIIALGLGLTALAVGLMSPFHTLSQLILFALLFGIGMGIAMPASLAMAADFSPASTRGLTMAISTCFFQVGFAVGTTAMGLVGQVSDFQMVFLASGLSIALGFLLIFGLMRVKR